MYNTTFVLIVNHLEFFFVHFSSYIYTTHTHWIMFAPNYSPGMTTVFACLVYSELNACVYILHMQCIYREQECRQLNSRSPFCYAGQLCSKTQLVSW